MPSPKNSFYIGCCFIIFLIFLIFVEHIWVNSLLNMHTSTLTAIFMLSLVLSQPQSCTTVSSIWQRILVSSLRNSFLTRLHDVACVFSYFTGIEWKVSQKHQIFWRPIFKLLWSDNLYNITKVYLSIQNFSFNSRVKCLIVQSLCLDLP